MARAGANIIVVNIDMEKSVSIDGELKNLDLAASIGRLNIYVNAICSGTIDTLRVDIFNAEKTHVA